MRIRKLFILGAAVAALGVAAAGAAASAAVFQTSAQKAQIKSAKASGVVGEQADGYLGFHTASSDASLRAAVEAVNAGRRSLYARTGSETGVSTDVAAARMFESQLMPRLRSGEWYKNSQGQWVQR